MPLHGAGMGIEILTPVEIVKMRKAGRAAADTLAYVAARIRPGISTGDIERWVREDTARRGGKPSQLGYKGFPAAVCTSRNSVVCHGIPRDDELLVDGDIVNVDVTTERRRLSRRYLCHVLGRQRQRGRGAARGSRAPLPRRWDRGGSRASAAR